MTSESDRSAGGVESPPPAPLFGAGNTEDQVPLAVRTLGCQFLVAIGWLGLLTWATLTAGSESAATRAAEIDPNAFHVNLLLYGLTLGIVLTGLVGWLLLRRVGSVWRRFALSVVGVLGGFTLGMVITMQAREIGGPPALLGVAGVSLAGVLLLIVTAPRPSAPRPSP